MTRPLWVVLALLLLAGGCTKKEEPPSPSMTFKTVYEGVCPNGGTNCDSHDMRWRRVQ